MTEFVNDGLTPYQALQTATVNTARYLRQSGEFGTVETGKRADLMLLDANPLENISATRQIAGVMLRGEWLPRDQLHRMVDDVPASYERDLQRVKQGLQTDPEAAGRYLDDYDPYGDMGGTALTEIAGGGGFDKLRELVRKIRLADPGLKLASESGINTLGYNLLARKKYPEAIGILQMNTEDFPESSNTYDSLAEAQFKSGDLAHALENYRRALEVDPKYGNADFAKKFLEEKGTKK